MAIEICENCKRTIGLLEQAFVYNGHIVCPDCNQLLQKSSGSLEKKVTEHPDNFDKQPKVETQSNQISVTEEDFLVTKGKTSNPLDQEPLKITPEDFQPVSVPEQPTFTVGPEDFETPPLPQSKLTETQEKFQDPKSIRVEESDFISKPIAKSVAKEVAKATGMSFKAKVLTFIIVAAAAGGGAFVAYEGGPTKAKTEINYLWSKLSFSATSASPEEVCKMYLLARWKGDRGTTIALLTQNTQRIMADVEQQQDPWRREQVERLQGRKLSDSEWQNLKAEIANAEPKMAAMFEGTNFDFQFGETSYPDNQKATVEMQFRIEMKGPFFENWKQMIRNQSNSGSAGDKVSNFIEGFWSDFGSKWWNFKFVLVREGNTWKIEDIEMPIGEMMESMFNRLEETTQ